MKKVALDIDDVLAGFYSGMCKRYGRPELQIDIWDGKGASFWVAYHCQEADRDEMFWLQLDPVSNPEAITFDFECYITSSPEDMIGIRRLWLAIQGFPDKPVYYSEDKLKTMRELDIDILVDDKPSIVNAINDSKDKIALQFKPSYMSAEIKNKDRIITHLSQVKKYL